MSSDAEIDGIIASVENQVPERETGCLSMRSERAIIAALQEARREIERLRFDRDVAVGANNGHKELLQKSEAERDRMRIALRIIAGKEQCIDNLLSNVEIAQAALTPKEPTHG